MKAKKIPKAKRRNKKERKFLQKQLEEGRVLRVDDGFDNKQTTNEADYNASQ